MKTAPRGAVMVLGLALLAVAAVMVYVMARSAIFTTEKSRSMALADASAKSVANWYAQILNYDAYSNRVIAANEIMMAQSVTMAAWTRYMQTLANNIGTAAAVIPAVQPMANWIRETAALSHQMARTGALTEVPLRAAYTRALQGSQQIMHASATPFAAQAMVNEVIWSGDQRFFGQIIPSSNISGFYSLTQNYTDRDRAPLVDLVRSSQDSFSKNRGYDSRLYLMPTGGCLPTSFDKAFSKLIRRGGTWLTGDYSNWESVDTLSIHTWRRRGRWNPTCGGIGESIALGWGSADANSSGAVSIREDPVGANANPAAFNNARASGDGISLYPGMSAFRELNAQMAQNRKSASIRVPVLVRLPITKAAEVTAGQGVIAKEAASEIGGAIWSLSVGETYFIRPADTMTNPSLREFANLFSPFWSARLVAPDAADRTVAMALAQARSAP